ncbi:MAG TPA: hypothetical protein VHF25_02935 [Nitriliruptorales bacterium]|nr:hypothetical protein [Nitriliruptorales bacterium]
MGRRDEGRIGGRDPGRISGSGEQERRGHPLLRALVRDHRRSEGSQPGPAERDPRDAVVELRLEDVQRAARSRRRP